MTGSHISTVRECLSAPVRDAFKVIVSADDVVKGKPSPEPYLAALEKLRAAPDRALVVENAPMGIASASAAGIYCIAIETTLPQEYLKGADMIVRNHEALAGTLDFICSS